MNLFFRVSGIAFILLVFLGTGVFIGTREASRKTVVEGQRFISTNRPGFAFDTKLGLECDMDGVNINLPPGYTLDIPRCATLAKR